AFMSFAENSPVFFFVVTKKPLLVSTCTMVMRTSPMPAPVSSSTLPDTSALPRHGWFSGGRGISPPPPPPRRPCANAAAAAATRALAMAEAAVGREHPSVASNLDLLGDLARVGGRYADAESCYRRALAIREKAFGPNHVVVGDTVNALAQLYRVQGRFAD